MLGAQDCKGITPAMLAIKKQNHYALKYLVGKNVDLSQIDATKNNAFHFAAASSKEIIEV